MDGEQLHQPVLEEHITERKSTCCRPSCRHVLAILAFLGFINVYAMRVNLSVAIVSMVKPMNDTNKTIETECPGDNSTDGGNSTQTGEFEWDSTTQNLVLGSFFYGYIVTQIPGGYLAELFGGKKLFGYGVLCTAIFTLLTPLAARLHVGVLVAVRILEGLGEGVTFPAMHAMLAKWAPKYERSKLGTFIYAGAQFGTVVSMPISGLLCEHVGWPSVFYVFGCCGVVWFIVWMVLAADSPALHPRITNSERDYIEKNIGHSTEKLPMPCGPIWSSIHVWAIIVSHFCFNWGFYTLLTNLPTYMKDILKFDISNNGFLSALPYLVMWLMIVFGGQLADFLRHEGYLSTRSVRKIFNSIGALGPCLCLIAVTYAGCERVYAVLFFCMALGISGLGGSGASLNHLDIAPPFAGVGLPACFLVAAGYLGCDAVLSVAMITLAVGFAGFALSGFQVNHLDIAPPYAGTLLGITNSFATIPGFAGPAVVGALTDHASTRAQWRKVFFISSGIYAFGGIFFALFASGEEQEWAKPEYHEEGRQRRAREEGIIHDEDEPLIEN